MSKRKRTEDATSDEEDSQSSHGSFSGLWSLFSKTKNRKEKKAKTSEHSAPEEKIGSLEPQSVPQSMSSILQKKNVMEKLRTIEHRIVADNKAVSEFVYNLLDEPIPSSSIKMSTIVVGYQIDLFFFGLVAIEPYRIEELKATIGHNMFHVDFYRSEDNKKGIQPYVKISFAAEICQAAKETSRTKVVRIPYVSDENKVGTKIEHVYPYASLGSSEKRKDPIAMTKQDKVTAMMLEKLFNGFHKRKRASTNSNYFRTCYVEKKTEISELSSSSSSSVSENHHDDLFTEPHFLKQKGKGGGKLKKSHQNGYDQRQDILYVSVAGVWDHSNLRDEMDFLTRVPQLEQKIILFKPTRQDLFIWRPSLYLPSCRYYHELFDANGNRGFVQPQMSQKDIAKLSVLNSESERDEIVEEQYSLEETE